jgi:hypothetical protein
LHGRCSPASITRAIQTLRSSLARAKASLPSAEDALDVLPSLIDDSPDTFQLDFESARVRVTSLLDVAASSFDTAGARDCGWKGVIDTAKDRLLHAQVTFFDGLFGSDLNHRCYN